MPSEVEIGVWVEGVQKWVTGVTRRTSCRDIIKALLRAQCLPALDSDVNDYVIVERWRKVERPLDHEQRILKVWKTWGEAIQEVRFTLRRIRSEGWSDSEAGSRIERSRRRHKLKQSGGVTGGVAGGATMYSSGVGGATIYSTGNHRPSPSPLPNKNTTEDAKLSDTMERLMRLVVAQGETIQTQVLRMQERDQQIENFEHQLHLLRVRSLGSDYLLQSYLKDPVDHQETSPFSKEELLCEEKSNDSGVVTEEGIEPELPGASHSDDRPVPPVKEEEDFEDVSERMHLLDKLDHVLIRLLEHEEALSTLEDSLAESSVCEMSHLQEQISDAAVVHANTVATSRQNELKLREMDVVLYQRRMTLEALLEEDLKYEEEAMSLQAHLDYVIHLPPTAFKLPEEDQKTNAHPVSNSSFKRPSIPPTTDCVGTPSQPHNITPPEPCPSKTLKPNYKKPSVLEQKLPYLSPSILKTSPKEVVPALASIPTVETTQPTVVSTRTQVVSSETIQPPVVKPKSHSEPPPIPSTSPPPLDEDDDKDSGKTSSLCVSSRSSTSSDSSRGRTSSPTTGQGPSSKPGPPQTTSPESTKDIDSADSNSDTGLSSLHSSSDEGAYVLDTLV